MIFDATTCMSGGFPELQYKPDPAPMRDVIFHILKKKIDWKPGTPWIDQFIWALALTLENNWRCNGLPLTAGG